MRISTFFQSHRKMLKSWNCWNPNFQPKSQILKFHFQASLMVNQANPWSSNSTGLLALQAYYPVNSRSFLDWPAKQHAHVPSYIESFASAIRTCCWGQPDQPDQWPRPGHCSGWAMQPASQQSLAHVYSSLIRSSSSWLRQDLRDSLRSSLATSWESNSKNNRARKDCCSNPHVL